MDGEALGGMTAQESGELMEKRVDAFTVMLVITRGKTQRCRRDRQRDWFAG
jgi:hypothetical protein